MEGGDAVFSEQLKIIRRASGKTQRELAEFLNISAQSVSKWEKGESLPSIEYLPKIAQFFDCSINAFFTEITPINDAHDKQSGSCGKEANEYALKINKALSHFRLGAEVINVIESFRIMTFHVKMHSGTGISDIEKRQKDIIYSIGANGVKFIRNEGDKNIFEIQIPRKGFNVISLKDAAKRLEYVNSSYDFPIIIGYDSENNLIIDDLCKMPHLLIGGVTGSGKSVFLRNIINCLFSRSKEMPLELNISDAKKCEFTYLKNTPYPVRVIEDIGETLDALESAVKEMNKRLKAFEECGVRNIRQYNQGQQKVLKRIVFIVDELTDLMLYSERCERLIMTLTQRGAEAGIHLILASQRNASSVITPLVKCSIPSRASLRSATKEDSMSLLAEGGAECLMGHGDMLYSSVFIRPTVRVQVPYINEADTLLGK